MPMPMQIIHLSATASELGLKKTWQGQQLYSALWQRSSLTVLCLEVEPQGSQPSLSASWFPQWETGPTCHLLQGTRLKGGTYHLLQGTDYLLEGTYYQLQGTCYKADL